MPMVYTRQVMDLDTGETSWLSLGEHMTITEAAASLGFGPRKFREVLLHLGVLHREEDPRSGQHRSRLSPAAVQSGFGIRHDRFGFVGDVERQPFDVLSPLGMTYIREHLKVTLAALERPTDLASEAAERLSAHERGRLHPMTAAMRTAWLADHFPKLTATEIAGVLGISRQAVSKHLARRQRQLEHALRLRQQRLVWPDVKPHEQRAA